MNPNLVRAKLYRISYQCHSRAHRMRWWTLAAAVIAIVTFGMADPAFAGLPFRARTASAIAAARIFFWIAGAWVVFFAALWLITGWFNVWFRYAAWLIASYWRAGLAIVAAAGLLVWKLSLGYWPWAGREVFFTTSNLLKTAAVAVFSGALYEIYRAHTRLVILPFANYTGDDTSKTSVEGLASLLLNEINRLAELYTTVNQLTPIGHKQGVTAVKAEVKAPNVTISVGEMGEVLQGAVSPESKIKFWGIEVPVGSLLRIFGSLARGPRLSGSLHKEGRRLVLIARIDRDGRPGTNWRVDADSPPDATAGAVTDAVEMNEQLAYRVFTDLVRTGSRSWQAVRCYTEGLRQLRITTRTSKDKAENLRKAERAFLQALAEDNTFALNYYNLGIVYKSRDEPDAAQAVFRRAVKEDPTLTPAYYALAGDAWDRRDYRGAIRFCDQVIALQPTEARAWDLKGLSERKIQEQVWGALKAGEHPEAWPESLLSRELGAALAWRALCGAVLLRREAGGAKDVARDCLRSAGVAHSMLRDGRGRTILRQALYLAPVDAELHFDLANILMDKPARLEAAASHFSAALGIEPTQSVYWAYLAENRGELFKLTQETRHKQEAWEACRHALDCTSDININGDIGDKVKAALESIGEPKEARRVSSINTFLARIENRSKSDRQKYIGRLKRWERLWRRRRTKAAGLKWAFGNWAYGQVAIRLARELLQTDPNTARKLACRAIRSLQQQHMGEIRQQGLYGTLAMAYQFQQKPELWGVARFYAERAVALNPLRPWERGGLAEIWLALGEYERAEAEWNNSLDLNPDPGAWEAIASTYWNRGAALWDPRERKKAFQSTIGYFRRALKNIEATNLNTQHRQQIEHHGYLHFWIGMFHAELMEFDLAVSHVARAKRMAYKPLESTIVLGTIHTEAKNYDAAEASFREAVARIREQLRTKGKRLGDRDSGLGEEKSMNELLIMVYHQWSFSYSHRGVRLEKAVRLAQYTPWLIQQLDKSKAHDPQVYESEHLDCLGYAQLKMGKIQEGLLELERSVTLSASAGTYTRLAAAYLETATAASGTVSESIINKGLKCCVQAGNADLRQQFGPDIDDLKVRLGTLLESRQKAAADSLARDANKAKPVSGGD